MSKPPKQEAPISIGGTVYNVHPKVRQAVEEMHREFTAVIEMLKKLIPKEQAQAIMLDNIERTIEGLTVIPTELIPILEEIKEHKKPKNADQGTQKEVVPSVPEKT